MTLLKKIKMEENHI